MKSAVLPPVMCLDAVWSNYLKAMSKKLAIDDACLGRGFKVGREQRDEWSCAVSMWGGRWNLATFSPSRRTRECSGPPVRAQAARLDARSLEIFGACPRCPTCPTKIIKREERGSLFLPKFVEMGRLRLSCRMRFCSRGRTGWPGWTQPDRSRV
jgi:hypothetical protein